MSIRERSRREEGATAVEYAIMVAFIAVVIVAAVTGIGTALTPLFADPDLQRALTP